MQKRTLDERLALVLLDAEVVFEVKTPDGDIIPGELVNILISSTSVTLVIEVP